jgi:hypothetical protein
MTTTAINNIRFEVFLDGPREPVLSCEAQFARTIIDERPLLDIVEEYELNFLEQEQAGDYEYQSANILYRYLTDKSSRLGDSENYIGLLICGGCLCEGCWPIYAAMEETPDWVVWRNFSNPHLRGSLGKSYYDIGPFRFEKIAFWHEIDNLGHLL